VFRLAAQAWRAPSTLAWWEWGKLLGLLLFAISAAARAIPGAPALIAAMGWHTFFDFTCQWDRLTHAKACKKTWALVAHGLIAGGLPMLLAGCLNSRIVIFAVLAHILIDATNKLGLREPWGPIADQVAHALCIGLCAGFMQ
jgi:hypothetical protein